MTNLENVENICPYCNEHLMMNKKSYANHVRWCKYNPKYEQIRNSTIDKLKNKDKKTKEYTCNCSICNKEYKIFVTPNMFEQGKYRKTCSKLCANRLSIKNCNNNQRIKNISNSLNERFLKLFDGKRNIHNCLFLQQGNL